MSGDDPSARDERWLLDIARAAREIAAGLSGVDRATFLASLEKQALVLHRLIVIGEAAKRLSPTFRAEHEAIPLRAAAATRDVLVHHYDRVDLSRSWVTATVQVPNLLAQIEPLLPAPPADTEEDPAR